MLQVDLHNILTEEDALQKIQDIFTHVETQKETYVVTKDGRPVIAIVDVAKLDQGGEEVAVTPPAPVETAAVEPTPVPAPEMPSEPAVAITETNSTPEAPAPVETAAPAPTNPAPDAPGFTPLPPLEPNNGLPDMPEDPNNSSPLA